MKSTATALMVLMGIGSAAVLAAEVPIRCGEIVEAEFTKSEEFHDFVLTIDPGTRLDLMATPIGSTLKLHAKFLEPTGNVIWVSNDVFGNTGDRPRHLQNFVDQARIKTEAISSRGGHTLRVYNWNAGVYTLYINCLLRNGREIKAGMEIYEPIQPLPPPAPMPTAQAAQSVAMPNYTVPAAAPAQAMMEPGAVSNGVGSILQKMEANPGMDMKTQLKVAVVDFAKEKALGWLTGKLLKSKAGKILGNDTAAQVIQQVTGVGVQTPGSLPLSLPAQALAALPQGGAGAVAQDLLVAVGSQQIAAQAAQQQMMTQAAQQMMAVQQQMAAQAAQQQMLVAQAMQPPMPAPSGAAQPMLVAHTQQQAGLQPSQALLQNQGMQPVALPPAHPTQVQTAAASLAPAGVTLYSTANFGGSAESLVASDSNLRDNLIGNDNVSSIRIGPGCSAVLYTEIDYEGLSTTIMEDLVNLRDTRVGNASVSSVRVRCEGLILH